VSTAVATRPDAATPERRARRTGRSRPRRDLVVSGVHLAVLSSFGIAQPLFTEVDDGTLFVALDHGRWDIVVFALLVVVGPPALLLGLEALVALARPRAARLLHLVFVFALAGIIASQLVVEWAAPSGRVQALVAVAAAAAFAAAYARLAPVRSIVTVLAPTPLLFLVLFLFFSPIQQLTIGAQGAPRGEPVNPRVPVVMIVFDELPGTGLLDADRRIDARRFPNFARLGRDATWFRNATSPHGFTKHAVPAVVSGKRSEVESLSSASDHPDSLFSLFERGAVTAEEPTTDLCPSDVCANQHSFPSRMRALVRRMGLISMGQWLPEFAQRRLPASPEITPSPPAQAAAFMESVRRHPDRDFHYLHVMLPHVPWVYLPSGRRHASRSEPLLGLQGAEDWSSDAWLVAQGQQRHMLQLAYTDWVLGALLDRLEEQGLYDRALVVVVADHGISFRPGGPIREGTPANLEQIMSVPLFVKRPEQQRGRISEKHVRTIDVAPTVADVLDVRLPWRPDGQSVFASGRREPARLDFYTRSGRRLTLGAAQFQRRRNAVVERNIRIFGSGGDDLFQIGPRSDLVGRRADPRAGRAPARVQLAGEATRPVQRNAPQLPLHVSGTLVGPQAGEVDALAIAVNGRFAATTWPYLAGRAPVFTALLPESALQPGSRNAIQVYAVSGDREGPAPRLLAG
jgi:hypothetical protein